MPKRGAKKSENLEVRISYDTKQALTRKAKAEGRTVSAVLRELIHGYLTPAKTSAKNETPSRALTGITSLFRKPKIILASAVAALTASLVFMPTAMADDITLNIQGEIIRTDLSNTQSISKKTIETTVLISEGGSVGFELPSGTGLGARPHLKLQIQINDTVLPNNEDGVLITMSIIEEIDGEDVVVAQPSLKTALGQTAQFRTGVEGVETYSFDLLPSKS